MNLEILAHLGLDLHQGSCFSFKFHSFSSFKFVIGRFPFVLVLRVGLFVFAFFSDSRLRLEEFQGHGNSYPNMFTY